MKNILTIMFVLSLVACTSTSTTIERPSQNFEKLQELVDSKNFEIEAEWAYPLGSNRVNLFGNTNYFRMEGDRVNVYLPYYGIRRTGPVYGSGTAVEFSGAYENLNIEEKPAKNEIIISFDIREKSERFSVQVSVFGNESSTIFIDSSQRDDIRYDGKIVESTKN